MEECQEELAAVLLDPESYLSDEKWQQVASMLMPPEKPRPLLSLSETRDYKVYGEEGIEQSAKRQMDVAMQLPVAVSGALMPDAHQGYGLPIGGVLAADNAVIPYGVGVDIGCRMCLSIYDVPGKEIARRRHPLSEIILANSRFGKDVFEKPNEHSILESSLFREIPILRKLHKKARAQFGSSGGGNHFVEFGIAKLAPGNGLGLPVGEYLSLLTHSGSRGLGAGIAQHYTQQAIEQTPLPRHARHLAWLSLDTEQGQEYWAAMNLSGEYAAACHADIHRRVGKALRESAVAVVENHHNFAWKEQDITGKEMIVHRKGATPAGKGVLGVIPGSMTAPGYIVRGRGVGNALNSASHGAGRAMSRARAKSSFSKKYVRDYLSDHGVMLMGGGVDEAPMAYKDIGGVMQRQKELVDIIGSFHPKIVRMAED